MSNEALGLGLCGIGDSGIKSHGCTKVRNDKIICLLKTSAIYGKWEPERGVHGGKGKMTNKENKLDGSVVFNSK